MALCFALIAAKHSRGKILLLLYLRGIIPIRILMNIEKNNAPIRFCLHFALLLINLTQSLKTQFYILLSLMENMDNGKSPWVIRNSCTRWVPENCGPHPRMASVDWTALVHGPILLPAIV